MNEWHKQAFYRTSVVGVIRDEDDKYLLVNEHDRWSFPGGGWDFGESLHEALKRELMEEIALKSDFTERVITAVPFYNPNKKAWQMWIACDVMYDQLDYNAQEHASAVQWLAEDEIDYTTKEGWAMKQVIEARKRQF